MGFADVNGQLIRYEDSGGNGPAVVLAHGFLMDRAMFAPQVDALTPEFRVITWDERGFGETEFDGEPYTLQWFLSIESHRHGRHARVCRNRTN